jgi:glutaminase
MDDSTVLPEPINSDAQSLFDALAPDNGGPVTRESIEARLNEAGLRLNDARLKTLKEGVQEAAVSAAAPISIGALSSVLTGNGQTLLWRALRGDLVIPDFRRFCTQLTEIFAEVRSVKGGEIATYIPQLARVAPESYAVAVCTIDGQQFSLGDDESSYCVQSTCKPINYAIALDALGADTVHRHVGREPSGRSFNEITLNSRGLPHNPMINAGAIMCASLISSDRTPADRFDGILQTWRASAGGQSVGFDNAVFLSERDTADRNFALAYFMRESGAFPAGTDLHAALDLYFQCCSITLDVRAMAAVAGTFANGGICPTTDQRVFSSSTVKSCLSLMASCGMYDFSGEYAFSVGLPAKSGVSGALMIVVPGICGIALWSPRLDQLGNSVRGVAFSERLTKMFPFHTYADILPDREQVDPRRTAVASFVDEAVYLCMAASRGDVQELRRLLARGLDINSADYDGRTPLHLAASEGVEAAVRFLLERGANASAIDRWGHRPAQDAKREGHHAIAEMLESTVEPTELRMNNQI